jgi:hypothetical protein
VNTKSLDHSSQGFCEDEAYQTDKTPHTITPRTMLSEVIGVLDI